MDKSIEIIKAGIIFFEIDDRAAPNITATIDGTDVSDYLESLRITNAATDRLADCSILLDNPKGHWNKLWDGGEEIIIKMDYDDGTANQFVGKVDNPSPGFTNSYVYRITGKSYPELIDNYFIGDFDEEPIADAFKAVIDDLNTRLGTIISYSTTSIEDTNKTVSFKYREMNYLQVLKDLAKRADFDFYINFSGEFQAFTRGSKKNNNSSVVMGENVLNPSFFIKDNSEVRNVEKVYGTNKEGCLVMWTEKDDDSINSLLRKERIINETSIETVQEAKDKAASELSYDTVKTRGSPTVLGDPDVIPGYKEDIFLPYIFEGEAILMQYTQRYSLRTGWETDKTFERRARTSPVRFAETDRRIREQQSFFNPNAMLYSAHFTFDNNDQVASHSDTSTSDGKLKMESSVDTATMISTAFDADEDISSMEVRFNGNTECDLCEFWISADDGSNYEQATPGISGEPGTLLNIANTGKKVRLKIIMKSDSADNEFPAIDSAGVYWK
jgi:hypothetical protein